VGTLIKDLIQQVAKVAENDTLSIKRIKKGFRFTGTMLEDGSCGFCFSVFNQDPLSSCEYLNTQKAIEKLDIIKILQFATNSEMNLERIIGISTLNAISQYILKHAPEDYEIRFNTDPITHMTIHQSDKVVMIGNIGTFLLQLQKITKSVVIIDDRSGDLESSYLRSPENMKSDLQDADVVLITGSSLVNNTLENLLKTIVNAREIAIVGPSAGFVPDPLFARGVTMVCGMQVLDPNKVLNIIAKGGGTPHFKSYCRKYNIIKSNID